MWATQVWCKSSVHLLEVCFVIQGELSFFAQMLSWWFGVAQIFGVRPRKGDKKKKTSAAM